MLAGLLTCVRSSPKPSQNSLSVTTPSQSLSISRISRAATGSARRRRSTLVRGVRLRVGVRVGVRVRG